MTFLVASLNDNFFHGFLTSSGDVGFCFLSFLSAMTLLTASFRLSFVCLSVTIPSTSLFVLVSSSSTISSSSNSSSNSSSSYSEIATPY